MIDLGHVVMPDAVHCFHCTQEHGLLRLADIVSHGHYDPMRLCWEHVEYRDAPVHMISQECTDACSLVAWRLAVPPREPKLVSVCTPTWGRYDLLMEAIANVRAQTYRPLEHVVISDGLDPALADRLQRTAWAAVAPDVPLRFVQLGRRWTLELDDSYAAAAVIVAQFVARGDYQLLWADDERATPYYVELMVKALETTGADFAYPRTAYYQWQDPSCAVGIGTSPPLKGGITTALYRTSVFNKAKGAYRTHTGRENDWDFFSRMMEGGASHVFVDRVIHTHRDDRGGPPELYTAPLPEYANA